MFVARHGLWAPVAWPAALASPAAVAGAWVLVRWARSHLPWFGEGHAGWLASLLGVLLTLVVAVGVFLILHPIVAAPFTDHLTDRVETVHRGQAPRTSVLRSTWQAVAHGALKSACYAVALITTFVLGMTTGAGAVLGVGCYALFLAYDGFDYPLARRGTGFRGKWRYLVRHPALTAGYGAGAFVMQLIPLAFLAAPALSAAGATLAFLDQPGPRPDDRPTQPAGGRPFRRIEPSA